MADLLRPGPTARAVNELLDRGHRARSLEHFLRRAGAALIVEDNERVEAGEKPRWSTLTDQIQELLDG